MKRGIIFIYFIAFLFLINVALAAHSTTVSINQTSSYETLKKGYTINLVNDDTSTSSINSVTISLNGFILNEVKSLSGWSYIINGNSVTFWTSTNTITPGFRGPFKLNATANQVNADTVNTWNINTIDNISDTYSNTVSVTTLNDINPPSITNINPNDYSFVKNQLINFVVTVQENETSISPNYFYMGYRDDTSMELSGVVNNYIQLIGSGINQYSGSLDPKNTMNLPNNPFLDYRFVNLSDAAGNTHNEGTNFPHHLYVDSQSPNILLNGPVDSFATSDSLVNFTFNATDNSFEAIGQGSFLPILSCTVYVSSLSNTKVYTNSINDTGIEVNISSLADGAYSWYIECKDSAGQIKQTVPRTLIKDITGPEITLNSPLNDSVIKASDILDFSISDNSSVSSAWYSLNGVPIGLLNSPYDVNTSAWLEGINKIIIYSNDTLNNLAQEEFTFTVDATPPNIILINPPNNTLTNQDQNYYYNATDTYSTNLSCKLLIDSIEQSSKTSLSGSIDSLTTSLPNGTYEWQINCTDEVGFSNISEKYTIIIDKDLPVVNLLSPADLSNDDDGLVTFNYSATDANNILNCSLYIDNIFNQATLTLDNFTATLAASNNPYNWFISCYDNAQNKKDSVSISVYYDNINPIISEINSSSVSDTTATINWITDEHTNGTIYYGPSCNNWTNSLSFDTLVNGNHSIVLTSLSPSTTYYYIISSTDRFGNQVNSSCDSFTTSATPSSPNGGGGGGSSGGGGGITCITNWTCSDWSECSINSIQTRTCVDENACVKDSFETRSCTYKECTNNDDCLTGYICENNECVLESEELAEETSPLTGFSILDFLNGNKRGIGAGIAMLAIIVCLMYLYGLRKRPRLVSPEVIRETIRNGKLN